jgi:hypothetical protein
VSLLPHIVRIGPAVLRCPALLAVWPFVLARLLLAELVHQGTAERILRPIFWANMRGAFRAAWDGCFVPTECWTPGGPSEYIDENGVRRGRNGTADI